jgi:hypothetical protein
MKASGMLAIRIRIFHQQRFGKKIFFSVAVQRDACPDGGNDPRLGQPQARA